MAPHRTTLETKQMVMIKGILRRNVSLNSGGKAQPWAFGAVFKWDGTGNSSESTIWSNSSTSASLSNMHIRAYIESGGELAFRYGDASNYIIRKTSSSFISTEFGMEFILIMTVMLPMGPEVIFRHNILVFELGLVDLSTGAVSSPSLVNSNGGNGWTTHVNNRIQIGVVSPGIDEFDGQIASVVATTLAINENVSDAEISAIIINPMGWLCNYKVGNPYRRPNQTSLTSNFSLENKFSSYSTRVWLMGDGTGDASGNIKNQVNIDDDNNADGDDTRLNLTGVSPQNISGVNIDGVVPTISSVSLNSANSQLTVTFSEDVYTNAGSGDLVAADFALDITGGVATVASTPTGITVKTAQNIWFY